MSVSGLDIYQFGILHSQHDRWLRLVIATALKTIDLTMMEWLLLVSVNKTGRSGLSITAAAEALGVSLPQVTALAHRLQKHQAVTTQSAERDKRSRQLRATDLGTKLCKRSNQKIVQQLAKDIPKNAGLPTYLAQLKRLSDENGIK